MKTTSKLALYAFLVLTGFAFGRTELSGINAALNLRVTGNLTPGAVAANSCGTNTFTLNGASINDECIMSAPGPVPSGLITFCTVDAANTLVLHACNGTNGSLTPPSGTYTARIFVP